MLAFNRLRIDHGDGCPAVEYRIEDDHVHSRVLGSRWYTQTSSAASANWVRGTNGCSDPVRVRQ
jgi:hypothetical protein